MLYACAYRQYSSIAQFKHFSSATVRAQNKWIRWSRSIHLPFYLFYFSLAFALYRRCISGSGAVRYSTDNADHCRDCIRGTSIKYIFYEWSRFGRPRRGIYVCACGVFAGVFSSSWTILTELHQVRTLTHNCKLHLKSGFLFRFFIQFFTPPYLSVNLCLFRFRFHCNRN